MKLAIHYIRDMAIAVDMQSIVSLLFFLFFIYVSYIIITGNKKEYKEYSNAPFEEGLTSDKFDSQDKSQ
ncbi:MAG: CcoQ/FixQ family Cbb3-type cytochrome c oxidase assembly chaperone [Bacteroidales bacterium]|nr:CcoQ/FixQ family Cbb3-type cytochrome c oxidase assembly chaperone [Bacteroidales bacterium]